MFIYMTKPGDDTQKVAKLFYNDVSNDVLKRILAFNVFSKAVNLGGGDSKLAAYSPVYLPDLMPLISDDIATRAIQIIEQWPYYVRQTITQMMNNGISFNDLICRYNKVLYKKLQNSAQSEKHDQTTASSLPYRQVEPINYQLNHFRNFLDATSTHMPFNRNHHRHGIIVTNRSGLSQLEHIGKNCHNWIGSSAAMH